MVGKMNVADNTNKGIKQNKVVNFIGSLESGSDGGLKVFQSEFETILYLLNIFTQFTFIKKKTNSSSS